MPITESEQNQLRAILAKMTTGQELMKFTGLVYDTLINANMRYEPMLALGKLIFARVPWAKVAEEWIKIGATPHQLRDENFIRQRAMALNENVRLPLLRAAEEYLRPQIADLFEIVVETVAEPEPAPIPADAQGSEDEIAQQVMDEAVETAAQGDFNFEDDEDPDPSFEEPAKAVVRPNNGHKKKRKKKSAGTHQEVAGTQNGSTTGAQNGSPAEDAPAEDTAADNDAGTDDTDETPPAPGAEAAESDHPPTDDKNEAQTEQAHPAAES